MVLNVDSIDIPLVPCLFESLSYSKGDFIASDNRESRFSVYEIVDIDEQTL
jgi:hypothetical protein